MNQVVYVHAGIIVGDDVTELRPHSAFSTTRDKALHYITDTLFQVD